MSKDGGGVLKPVRIVCGFGLLVVLFFVNGSHHASAHSAISFAYLYGSPPSSYETSIKRTQQTFNRVSPTYFGVASDGSLKLETIDPTFIYNMHLQNIKVVPRLTADWNRGLGEKALANRDQFTSQIAKAVKTDHLDGVNVDLENLVPSDKQALTDFVAELKKKLGTKEVSVALAANPQGWTKGWQGSYDDAALAKVSDYVILMAYDESFAGSAPGPVAGFPFVKQSVTHVLNEGVNKDKLVLGIPLYGRVWNTDFSVSGDAVPLYDVPTITQNFHPSFSYLNAQQTPVATFAIGGDNTFRLSKWANPLPAGIYTLYYENVNSISSKLNLMNHFDLGGSAVWSVGQDDPSLWSFYKAALNPFQGIK